MKPPPSSSLDRRTPNARRTDVFPPTDNAVEIAVDNPYSC
jgi:hypothetical protein